MTGIDKAIKAAGSQTALAALIETTPQRVSEWARLGYVPPSRIVPVATATGVSPDELGRKGAPRNRILTALRASSPLTAAELAKRLKLPGQTVRNHIGSLAAEGLIVKTPVTNRKPGDPFYRCWIAG